MAKVYLKDGCGGMLAFSVKGGMGAGRKLLESFELIGHMANLGDSRTIAIHPASTTHSQLTREQRLESGLSEGLIRLSVGIEDVSDIINDLKNALEIAVAE